MSITSPSPCLILFAFQQLPPNKRSYFLNDLSEKYSGKVIKTEFRFLCKANFMVLYMKTKPKFKYMIRYLIRYLIRQYLLQFVISGTIMHKTGGFRKFVETFLQKAAECFPKTFNNWQASKGLVYSAKYFGKQNISQIDITGCFKTS